MPTTPERLAALEAMNREQDRRLSGLEDALDGGPSVPYERSVRGKLHAMASAMASADKLREAAQAVERAQREQTHTAAAMHSRRFSRWTQAAFVVCAAITAAAPYVLHFAG